MIRRVSAALLVRDGFSGQIFTSTAEFFCKLDGLPIRPIWKKDGYLILTDLCPGEHTLLLRRRGFQEEIVRFVLAENQVWEDNVNMRPAADYRFTQEPVRMKLTLKSKNGAAGQEVWLGMNGAGASLKLAQDRTDKPERKVRLFCKGNAALLPIPGWYLIADEKQPELVLLEFFSGETGILHTPMTMGHGRGKEMIPMNRYYVNEQGSIELLFRQEGRASVFCRNLWKQYPLHSGEQSVTWDLEE